MRPIRILTIAIFLTGCSRAESPQQAEARVEEESRAARAEIESITTNFARWFTNGAIDSAAAQLTSDYRWQGPNAPAGSGREAWLTMMKGVVASGKMEMHHTTESVVASGPIAVESGSFVLRVTPGPGAPKGATVAVDTGKFLWQWRKVNGAWQLAQASWNSDLPPGR